MGDVTLIFRTVHHGYGDQRLSRIMLYSASEFIATASRQGNHSIDKFRKSLTPKRHQNVDNSLILSQLRITMMLCAGISRELELRLQLL